MKFFLTAFLGLALSAPIALARPLTAEEKINDFSQLVFQIETGYGPLLYKKEKQNISVQDLRSRYVELIKATPDNGSYYYLLNKFIAEFHDGHFGGSVPTTRAAKVGLMTELVQGKVLIASIDKTLLPEAKFNFARGDEILEVDGQPVLELVNELKSYLGSGYALTEQAMGTWLVFNRPGTKVPVPTAKTVKAKIRRGTGDVVEEVELAWNVTGEGLDEFLPPNEQPAVPPLHLTRAPVDYDRLSAKAVYSELLGKDLDRSYMCNPGTRIAKPQGATVIMETPFVAYYYPTAKGNVGYLRIPDYLPVNPANPEGAFAERLAQYQYAVSVLEKNTVGLVIDQDHNCGGSVGYLHDVLGLFMTKDYAPTQFELRASKSEYLAFKAWVEEVPPFTLDKDRVKVVAELVKASWLKGDYLTPKTSISGDESYQPNRVHYTKPILVLIDYMAGSGGDAFPSLIKGYGRAKLLGTRTSGLGGHVQPMPPLNYSAFSYRMTRSLFYRPDGVPVENNGAEPDIAYEITRDDFMYEYKPYREFYTAKLLEMIE